MVLCQEDFFRKHILLFIPYFSLFFRRQKVYFLGRYCILDCAIKNGRGGVRRLESRKAKDDQATDFGMRNISCAGCCTGNSGQRGRYKLWRIRYEKKNDCITVDCNDDSR